VDELLDLVELTGAARKRVKGYSLGMRQRLSLATALLGDPKGLILDEPANGLDPQGIRWLRDFLRARRDEGRTILVSSHVLSEVAQVADEVIVINHGRTVATGTVEELTSGGTGALLVRTRDPVALTKALEAKGATVSTVEGDGRLSVQGVPAETVGDLAAGGGIPIYELRPPQQTLEDVFLELTREGAEEVPE
jgi:ABC-2 type transport system ATP-binding protein